MRPKYMSEEIESYWNKKFLDEKKVWGDNPSLACKKAVTFIRRKVALLDKITKILDIGAGYGRDIQYFLKYNYDVEGIDISENAVQLAKEHFPDIPLKVKSIFNTDYKNDSFDIVFGNFVIHLFDYSDRKLLRDECYRMLKSQGWCIFSVASIKDADYGKGETIGPNLYRNSRGVLKYYYSESNVLEEFNRFSSITIEPIKEFHTHGNKPHVHKSYIIYAQK